MLTLLLVGMLTLALRGDAVSAEAKTITVPDEYPTIQEAIDHANSGDTIYVKAGTYYENIVVTKSLVLMGENRQSIIDGNRSKVVVWVGGWNVTINGFTICNGGDLYSGIRLLSSEAKIINNNITNNWRGIDLDNTRGNIILNNSITDNMNGISGQSLYDCVVAGNIIADNMVGLGLTFHSSRNTIASNDIRNHWDAGIFIWDSYQNVIVGNNVLLNNQGNYSSAIMIGQSSYNRFFHNNIINRGKQVDVTTEEINIWDDDYPSGGNYWSDYSGSDLYSGPFQNRTGSDGIGDTPHTIAVKNEDRYPLAHPYTLLAVELNLTEYYEALANFVNLQSKYDDLMSRHNSLQAELDDLRSEFDGLQSEHSSLTSELNLTRNIVYVLLITITVFMAATVFLSTRKLKAGPSGPPLTTKLKESITSANQRVYAMVSSSLDRFSITSLGTLYVFLTVVDIAQTLWGFPEYEVGVLARAFIVFLSDRAWLYFPFRIVLTSLIVIAVYKWTTPSVSKKLFLILSLMTLAAVIWNTYTLMMSVA